jgi:predicted Rossmann fold nucleotide-binding protein DprA/Smf involved in DNA uptake
VGIQSLQGKGTAKLATDGAKVIKSAQDILAEWGFSKESVSIWDDKMESKLLANQKITSRTGDLLASSLARSLNIEI